MGGINLKRVLLGGLLAGLVINVSEIILNMWVLGDEMNAALQRMNISMAPWAIPFYIVMAFLLGIGLTGLYAAIRPRLGEGPRTAIIAGVAFWFFVSLLPTFSGLAMGMSFGSAGAVTLAIIWGLVEMPVAALVGGWAYHEGETSTAARAATVTGGTGEPQL